MITGFENTQSRTNSQRRSFNVSGLMSQAWHAHGVRTTLKIGEKPFGWRALAGVLVERGCVSTMDAGGSSLSQLNCCRRSTSARLYPPVRALESKIDTKAPPIPVRTFPARMKVNVRPALVRQR